MKLIKKLFVYLGLSKEEKARYKGIKSALNDIDSMILLLLKTNSKELKDMNTYEIITQCMSSLVIVAALKAQGLTQEQIINKVKGDYSQQKEQQDTLFSKEGVKTSVVKFIKKPDPSSNN